jgi:hypothetical protein
MTNYRALTAKLVMEKGMDFIDAVQSYPDAYKPEIVTALEDMADSVSASRDDADFPQEMEQAAKRMLLSASVSVN